VCVSITQRIAGGDWRRRSGNTLPSLLASGARIMLITVLALIASRMPGFRLSWIWYLSVGSVFVQLALSMWLLRGEFGRRLRWDPAGA
jgi:hypothetical protein